MEQLIKNTELAVSKAVMQLMRRSNEAFVTTVILNLERVIVAKEDEPYVAVKGTTMFINAPKFLELSENDQRWWLLHSAWHVIGFDEVRSMNREAEQWNQACDHYIDNMLHTGNSANLKHPDDASIESKFKDWEKEDIYKYILQQQQQQQNQNGQGNGQGGNSGDLGNSMGEPDLNSNEDGDQEQDGQGNGNQGNNGNQPSPQQMQQQMEQLEKQISNIVQQSAMQAKMAGGHVPSDIQQYLEDLYNPKLPWDRLLLKYMDSYAPDDYSYQKVNRKFFPHGIILPTMFSEGLGRIAIANDESCSVSDEEFKTYLGAIQAIKETMNPEQMDIVAFTTCITNIFTVKQDDDIDKIKFRGHGGTDCRVVFDHFNKPENKPQVLIVFSDMESALPDKKPDYDVIWIAVNNKRFKAPFGREIHIEV